MHAIDHLAARFAAVQGGRFARAQVRPAATQSHGLIHSRIRTGRWLRLTSKVLALPGAPMDRVGDLWTASLHLGGSAVVSHGSAAHLHGLVAVHDCPPTLTVPNGSHRRSTEFVVHQCRDLSGGDVVRARGLPATSLARTIVDLAPAASVSRIETWLDHLTAEQCLHPAEVADVLARLSRRGKVGLGPLVEVVADRLAGAGLEMGPLERALTRVLESAGLGRGIAQHPHPARPEGGALVDRAFPALRLVVEADGRTWHDRKLRAAEDARRDRAALCEGWVTLRYRHEELVRSPDATARELREIHDRRSAELGPG